MKDHPCSIQRARRRATLRLLIVPSLVLAAACGPKAPDAPAREIEEPPPNIGLLDWPLSHSARRGREVYQKWCVGCHGQEGLGDGAAALDLDPLPRNFQAAQFKFRSTASGKLPTDEDLLRIITCGLPGSSMPSFQLVSEPARRDAAAYVLYLTAYGLARGEVTYLVASEGLSLDEIRATRMPEVQQRVRARLADRHPLTVPPEPEVTEAGLSTGRARYEKECAHCHGLRGIGDGPSAYALRNWRDAEIRPRDFTTGVFRAGSSSRDLYLRLKGGLDGTPMPSITGSDEDLWNLVHYMQSLIDPSRRGSAIAVCEHEGGGR